MTSRSKRRNNRRNRPRRGNLLGRWVWPAVFLVLLAVSAYVLYLDYVVRSQFEGKRWALPAQVYARPLELYAGQSLSAEQFESELQMLGYRRLTGARTPGSYLRRGDSFEVISRPFSFWDGSEPSHSFVAVFSGDALVALNSSDRTTSSLVRLDPLVVGRFYPAHNEDRILVRLDELPPALLDGLRAVEDKHYYEHWGVDLRAILRALWVDVKGGGLIQGGSTLTQQLVKNFYLTSDRTFGRKLQEAVMASLLELHYDKDQILEAYVNEIYLGQDRQRAIHGFGLASQFYFEKPPTALKLHEVALLIGIVKGPSYYDPRRQAKRALERRNLVLQTMEISGVITRTESQRARQQPLGVTPAPRSGVSFHPAFQELVRRQLQRDYLEEDLTSEGLRIFTTLDPLIQMTAERSVVQRISHLERSRGLEAGTLETAMLVSDATNGEILAVIGGRDPRYAGFNRALDAERQIGSLVKPVVYLTALEQTTKYNLATLLEDEPVSLPGEPGKNWNPKNYDQQSHGKVPLFVALAQSYNLATVRLGMELGLDSIIANLHRLGMEREVKPYPSILLGAVSMTPWEVTQMYQTMASGGFRTPLRAIRAVLGSGGEPLKRYPLETQLAVSSSAVYLLNAALREVVTSGTGSALSQRFPPGFSFAGKTGTTDNLRDSWFAGYTGDRLAVVWIGRDDNSIAGLTGATGAMHLWGDVMSRVGIRPLEQIPPPGVELAWVDPATGLLSAETCDFAVSLPFSSGTAPQELIPCARDADSVVNKSINLIRGFFE